MPDEPELDLSIETAREEDWEDIMPGFVEGTIRTLGPTEREELGPQTVQERATLQAEWIRGPEGFSNQVYVARTAGGDLAGHVWVARILNQFTGRSEALVVNIYVDEDYRGKGVGKRLMAVAEEWASAQDLDRIGLNVSVDNEPAVMLYRVIGYNTESQRMSKQL